MNESPTQDRPRGVLWLAIVTVLGAATVRAQLPAPRLTSSLDASVEGDRAAVSTDGTFDLAWTLAEQHTDGPISFELEEQRDGSDTTLLDAGSHFAAALSGRDDGVYRYRVRATADTKPISPWSAPIEVHVRHHALALALSVFAVGATVFLATASLIVLGHRRTRTPRD